MFIICFTLGSETVKNIQNNIVLLDILSIFNIIIGIFIVIIIFLYFCKICALASVLKILLQKTATPFFRHLDINFQCSTDIHSYMFYTVQFYNIVPEKTVVELTLYI